MKVANAGEPIEKVFDAIELESTREHDELVLVYIGKLIESAVDTSKRLEMPIGNCMVELACNIVNQSIERQNQRLAIRRAALDKVKPMDNTERFLAGLPPLKK